MFHFFKLPKVRISFFFFLLFYCSFAVSCDKDDADFMINNDDIEQKKMEDYYNNNQINIKHIYGDGNTYCAFTSLIKWEGSYYLAFREGASHVSPRDYGKIVILKSSDGTNWDISQKLSVDEVDLRDPNLSIMPDGNLYLLCGARKRASNNTYITTTLYSFSENGLFESLNEIKTSFDNIKYTSFWVWRIEWYNNIGYGTVYAKGEDDIYHAILVSSQDGIIFDFVSMIDVGDSPTECRLRFLEDGTMIALMRNDYTKSKGGYIGKSLPPYTNWEWKETNIPFAGQDFILINNNIFAVTRAKQNGQEKTGLFLIDLEGNINWKYMLPSYGKSSDTAYGSIWMNDEDIWVSYYSMHETTKPSIYLVKIPNEFLLSP